MDITASNLIPEGSMNNEQQQPDPVQQFEELTKEEQEKLLKKMEELLKELKEKQQETT